MSIEAARKRFKDFHGFEPETGDIGHLGLEGYVLVVGELDGIMYKPIGETKSSLHRFKKSDRPLLVVSSDGRQIYVLKGAYRFTQRGFEG